MHKPLTTEERERLIEAVPAPAMTRAQKLLRWAELVRKAKRSCDLMHNLEHRSPKDLDRLMVGVHGPTAFGLAARDPVLLDAGLPKPVEIEGRPMISVGDVARFMELSRADLHEFSCDCGGEIDNERMARRIEHIALNSPVRENPPQTSRDSLFASLLRSFGLA